MNKVRELKIDNTLWATPAKLINLLDFKPEKLTIDKVLNSIHNTPDASSKDLTDIHEVKYENGGFYLTIDNIKGYFKLDDNLNRILDVILTDDQKNKYHQVWKEVLKFVNDGNGELMLHEEIRLFDVNLPVEKYYPYLYDGCYNMSMKTVSTQNLTIINHNGNYYRVIFAFMTKKDAYNLIKNAIIMSEKGTL